MINKQSEMDSHNIKYVTKMFKIQNLTSTMEVKRFVQKYFPYRKIGVRNNRKFNVFDIRLYWVNGGPCHTLFQLDPQWCKK